MLQGLLLFLTWRWQSCGSQMLLHVAMITQLSIWWFFDRPNSLPRRICPSDVMFCLFLRILTPNWAVLIRRPGGSVPVMRCSLFLRGSWFPIGRSCFVATWGSFWRIVMFRLFMILGDSLTILIRFPWVSVQFQITRPPLFDY